MDPAFAPVFQLEHNYIHLNILSEEALYFDIFRLIIRNFSKQIL